MAGHSMPSMYTPRMSCSVKERSMSCLRLASLAPFTARDTLDLAMPALAAIAGSTRAYLRVDTPDTRISLMRVASPLSLCSCSYKGTATSRPRRPRLRSLGLLTLSRLSSRQICPP